MRLTTPKFWGLCLTALALAFAAQPAKAGFAVTFTNKTSTTTDVASQLKLTIEDRGGSDVRFVFRNVGTIVSFIGEIYFQDGALISPATAAFNFTGSGTGVLFQTSHVSPTNPPGINNFTTSVGLSADSQGGSGIDNASANSTAEFLYFNFTLSGGQTYANVINSLVTASSNWNVHQPGGLRVALHVKGFGSGGSDSYLSTGFAYDGNNSTGGNPIATPAPAGFVLLASALPVFGLRRLIRRKRTA